MTAQKPKIGMPRQNLGHFGLVRLVEKIGFAYIYSRGQTPSNKYRHAYSRDLPIFKILRFGGENIITEKSPVLLLS